jgi:hypothetical protein
MAIRTAIASINPQEYNRRLPNSNNTGYTVVPPHLLIIHNLIIEIKWPSFLKPGLIYFQPNPPSGGMIIINRLIHIIHRYFSQGL